MSVGDKIKKGSSEAVSVSQAHQATKRPKCILGWEQEHQTKHAYIVSVKHRQDFLDWPNVKEHYHIHHDIERYPVSPS